MPTCYCLLCTKVVESGTRNPNAKGIRINNKTSAADRELITSEMVYLFNSMHAFKNHYQGIHTSCLEILRKGNK